MYHVDYNNNNELRHESQEMCKFTHFFRIHTHQSNIQIRLNKYFRLHWFLSTWLLFCFTKMAQPKMKSLKSTNQNIVHSLL